ncbi:unnamed protein product, partial [Phaeothamnion confervicola]
MDALRRYVYYGTTAFAIDPTLGTLTSQGVGPSGNANAYAFDPKNRFMFGTNNSGTISYYSINANNGNLTLNGSVTPATVTPSSIAVDASGSFLYGSDSTNSVIY